MNARTPGLCRDCGAPFDGSTVKRCPSCRSPRLIRHAELSDLSIAHLDCDAFYAAVEKRDNPELVDRPLIIGGGRRGVVSTACYIARLYGVGSAMPMFKALEACPDAVVMRPNMQKYQAVGRVVRDMMRAVTPRIQPVSIDEAYLDLSEPIEGPAATPAQRLVGLAQSIENEIGITVSIGLSYNKSLAKLGSDFDKPRGFTLVGRAEAKDFLAPLSVRKIWGVGPAFARRLQRDGINRIGQLQERSVEELTRRYGNMGRQLARFARGQDDRKVEPRGESKSVSAETTLESNRAELADLESVLERLSKRVAERLERHALAGQTVVLKLKAADFSLKTRSMTLSFPTQRAAVINRAGRTLLTREVDGTRYRLIGIGVSKLADAAVADQPDMLEAGRPASCAPEGGQQSGLERYSILSSTARIENSP